MSQVTYEIIRKLFEIYPIILQTVLFLVLWNVFFRWEKGIWIVAGILAVMGTWEIIIPSLHGAMAGKSWGNTIYNVRCHCVGILFLQIPKTFGKGGIHTAAVLQFSCVKLFDCRQYLSMYSGEHI